MLVSLRRPSTGAHRRVDHKVRPNHIIRMLLLCYFNDKYTKNGKKKKTEIEGYNRRRRRRHIHMWFYQIESCRCNIFHAHLNAKRFRALCALTEICSYTNAHFTSIVSQHSHQHSTHTQSSMCSMCDNVLGEWRKPFTNHQKNRNWNERQTHIIASQVFRLFGKICTRHTHTHSHEAGERWTVSTLEPCAIRNETMSTMYFPITSNGSLLCRFCNILLFCSPIVTHTHPPECRTGVQKLFRCVCVCVCMRASWLPLCWLLI